MRILLLVVAIVLVFLIVRTLLLTPPRSRPPLPKDEQPHRAVAQDMVRCHRCGLHIPVQEAMVRADRYYCSAEHCERDQP
ncbi:PP0621 family protein [Thiorhodospira sibirica]|uniref:PP0621 family protein n=1 Tax=Thiorhodospira sibirica TaxID=154347 RepID=UPI00022C52D1|nr:PP0621 family protein [Thiorhodospira sibirica]